MEASAAVMRAQKAPVRTQLPCTWQGAAPVFRDPMTHLSVPCKWNTTGDRSLKLRRMIRPEDSLEGGLGRAAGQKGSCSVRTWYLHSLPYGTYLGKVGR